MKKILYSFLALVVVLPTAASAATFSFTPNTGTFTPGKIFSVIVYVNPGAGEEITTAQLSATLSASQLEIILFTQADGWIPLVAPGSDLIDNVAGKLLKTGGFPARVTASKQFGVLTLKAKSVGMATISVDGDSMLLDTANANKYVSSAGANFTIVTPTPTPTPTPEDTLPTEEELAEEVTVGGIQTGGDTSAGISPETETGTATGTETGIATGTATGIAEESGITDETGDELDSAGFAAASFLGISGLNWLWLLLLLILALIVFILWRKKKKKE